MSDTPTVICPTCMVDAGKPCSGLWTRVQVPTHPSRMWLALRTHVGALAAMGVL